MSKSLFNKRSRNLPDQSLVSCLNTTTMGNPTAYLCKTIITLFVRENNPISQSFYNNLISNLQFHQLTCTCGHSGCLSVHGYYYRAVKLPTGKVPFRICRVICECCGRTHALLLSSMVPYSQVSLSEHISIICNYEDSSSQEEVMNSNPSIDESCYRFIIRSYLNHWKQKLLSEHIGLSSVPDLIKSCFLCYSQQFMQIKNTSNILFPNTT